MQFNWKAHLALLAVNLIYAANYLVAKGIMPDLVPPSGFILMRVIGAVGLFWLLKAFIKEKVQRKDLVRLALSGLFGVCMNQLFFFEGLNLTSPLNASIIMTITPILVMLLSLFILKERITSKKVAGIVCGATGALLLILYSTDKSLEVSALGDLFILINATSYALYLVLVKPLMARYKPITVISYVFFFGAILVLCSPFAVSDFMQVEWSSMPSWAYYSIIYVVVATTILAYLLNIYALKSVRPTVSSSYIYLQPVTTALFAFLLVSVGDSTTDYTADLSWWKAGCAVLIFIGVYLISSASRSTKAAT